MTAGGDALVRRAPEFRAEDEGRLWVPDHAGEHYLDVLARLHATLGPRTYLEVGCEAGNALALATCRSAAVDPNFRIGDLGPVLANKPSCAFFRMTSDEFFAGHDPTRVLEGVVELAFLDGMHLCEFLLRDFVNTERHCRRDSVVILHDCLPVEAPMAERQPGATPFRPQHRNAWTGDVWRTALLLKRRRPELSITAVAAPPSGLVMVTNMDAASLAIPMDWAGCIREMQAMDLGAIGLARLFAEIGVRPTSALGDTAPAVRAFLEGR